MVRFLRSLTGKLTLAFLLVGLTGAFLVALIIGLRTRSEFDRFLSSRDQSVLVAALNDYYAKQHSWVGVTEALDAAPPLSLYRRGTTLTDPAGTVIFGRRTGMASATISAEVLNSATPLRENGQLVGYILLGPNREDDGSLGRHPLPLPPEAAFLQRVAWAATWSAGIAVAIALLLGSLLARNLTQPIRALTAATRAMASGNLDQRVVVRSRDELGELGESFNQMSTDLARASQLRTQMTADLAHDIRTPLSILRGYTEGLKDGRIQGNTSIYALMHAEVEHLQRLVEDLRVLSLADAGELPLNRRLVDPLALLERTGLAYVMQAEQHGVTLRIDPPEYDLPSVDVDTDRMAQVLNNLVSNALRYTPTGEIVLRAVVDDRQVCLSISDTGIGIASVDLPFVFDRFYRADKARRRGEGASGLGLAIAKAIVEAHGGTITADSTLGQGSTFTIRMVPASQHSSPT